MHCLYELTAQFLSVKIGGPEVNLVFDSALPEYFHHVVDIDRNLFAAAKLLN